MLAMVLEEQGRPLRSIERPVPEPAPGQLLVRVQACGVCRTDLHVVDGDLKHPHLPLVPGHEVIGEVVAVGPAGTDTPSRQAAKRDPPAGTDTPSRQATESDRQSGNWLSVPAGTPAGKRVGIPWLGWTCGRCPFCLSGRENLCDAAKFTGYDLDGGYAHYMVADARFCFPVPDGFSALQAAPLMCAGLIGYRSLRMAGAAARIGFYGFGAAAHILVQLACHQGRRVYAFTRPGDEVGQAFARSLGAVWAGDSSAKPPEELDAAILFAPVGGLLPVALRAVSKGGIVVCAGIHMSDIPSFPYELLWGERVVRSVANLTRRDGEEFLALAAKAPIKTEVTPYPLAQANEALSDLRAGRVRGAAVLVVSN